MHNPSMESRKTRKRIMDILLFAAVALFAAAVIYMAVSSHLRDAAEAKRNAAATELFLKSGLPDAVGDGGEGRLFSAVKEPWIAIRRDSEENAEWRVIACSSTETMTEDGLKDVRTLIVCENYMGDTEQYVRYVNGARQGGSVGVTSEGVNIRCIDLETGCDCGEGETLKAKALPDRNPKESDRRYSDAEVVKAVRRITASPICTGYRAEAWSYNAKEETLTVAEKDAMLEHRMYPVPEEASSIRSLQGLPGNIKALYIPPAVSFIGEGVLDGLWFVIADADSYAFRYAAEHGIACMENGSNVICAPRTEDVWANPFGEETGSQEGTWQETGAKALYIPEQTKIDDGFYWTGHTGLQVLVDRDSPAELFLLEQLGGYRTCCSYTYREAWLGESNGCTPDRGEAVSLGRYEQDGNGLNGPEPIEWIVLNNDGETALLLSRYALNCLNERNGGAQLWMHDEFAPAAFTDAELSVIVGDTLSEKVFLPGRRDVQGYLPSAEAREATVTKAARAEGGSLSWLLSGGDHGFGDVCRQGEICGWEYQMNGAIRPAIRIRTEAFNALGPQTAEYVPQTRETVYFGKNAERMRLSMDAETGEWIYRGCTEEEANEPIEWMVLDERDGMKLLLCNAYCPYRGDMEPHTSGSGSENRVQWAGSEVEQWLNSTFLEQSFTPEEQAAICPVVIRDGNEGGCSFYSETAAETEDRVFLLSIKELLDYLPNASDRIWYQREWWLRSKTSDAMYAVVWQDGHLASAMSSRSNATPRPAVWVKAEFLDAANGQRG